MNFDSEEIERWLQEKLSPLDREQLRQNIQRHSENARKHQTQADRFRQMMEPKKPEEK